MPSEAQARIAINKLLEEAGWRFSEAEHGGASNIICEHRVAKKRFPAGADLGADFQHAPNGFVDYLLLNTDGRPVAVVEAKRESIDPLSAKEQARSYAASLGVSHIFLSNGLVPYYWNQRQGNPVRMSRFLPLAELGKAAEWRPDPARLGSVAVDENYIAVSQDAAWLTYAAAERAEVAVNKKIRLLRDYQLAAIRELQKAALPGRHRFLFEMATGTGKTLLSAAIAKLYLRTENATRILFLVDRLELEKQAEKNFTAYLAADGIATVIYKQKRQDWKSAQVVVTTIQSLAAQNRFLTDFAPTDFQPIISDEAHRTISGNNRAIFEYFVGAKLGLTATPRDYLKGVDEKERADDPAAWERRLLLDTYRTFGSDDGVPTFRYSLVDAVRAKPKPYLVNPVALDARTDITYADAGRRLQGHRRGQRRRTGDRTRLRQPRLRAEVFLRRNQPLLRRLLSRSRPPRSAQRRDRQDDLLRRQPAARNQACHTPQRGCDAPLARRVWRRFSLRCPGDERPTGRAADDDRFRQQQPERQIPLAHRGVPRLRHQPHARLRDRRNDDDRLRLRRRAQCRPRTPHLLADGLHPDQRPRHPPLPLRARHLGPPSRQGHFRALRFFRQLRVLRKGL